MKNSFETTRAAIVRFKIFGPKIGCWKKKKTKVVENHPSTKHA
jgi:hypothetical protein